MGQNPNSSASQYRNLRTPQMLLENTRQNSYERDYGYIQQGTQEFENDPLFYNSRPMK